MLDKNLDTVVKIFNQKKIFYWIGQGSLLGIIRDKKLIDWDHDIDFCLWGHENIKSDFIKLLEEKGFKYRSDLGFGEKYDQMSFDKKGGRRIDLNFYQIDSSKGEEIAFTKWGYPKNIWMSLLNAISNSKNYDSKYKLIINNLYIFEKLAQRLKTYFIKKKLFYKVAGYKQPTRLLKKFKKINFEGLEFYIPYDAVSYLEYVYGENWKVPQKRFSWWKLKNLKHD